MADLFTLPELASWVQSATIDTATGTLAREATAALVESYCRTSFTGEVAAIETRRVDDSAVRLRRPVVSVSTVIEVETDGSDGDAVLGWTFDGIDTIAGLGLLPLVRVAYTHGFDVPPPAVKALALDLAASAYANPLKLKQETVGGYSATYAGGGDYFGLVLSPSQKRTLDRYRVRTYSPRIA